MKKILKERYNNLIEALTEVDASKNWTYSLERANGNYDNALFYLHSKLEQLISCNNEKYVGGIENLNFYFYAIDIIEEIMYKNNSFKGF